MEEKPEVKKAGGVYYTPTYIVDYIVKNTVGRLVRLELPPEIRRKIYPTLPTARVALGAFPVDGIVTGT